MKILKPCKGRIKEAVQRGRHPAGLDYPARKVGVSPGGVVVYATNDLGQNGTTVAQSLLERIDGDLSGLQSIFGTSPLASPQVVVANLSGMQDGSGGAYHWSCEDTTWYCDCCIKDPDVTAALAVAETVESFEAMQGQGWSCGDTNGEGLSRTLAEQKYPGKLDAYSTAAAWLDGGRPNYVDQQQGSDTDDLSNGCSVLFLWWLVSLGFGWLRIVQAGGTTLAQCYHALTGKHTAWSDFSAACAEAWPQGQPSNVQTDNPWPSVGGGGGDGGGGDGGGGSAGVTLTLSGDAPAGTYLLTPIPAGYDAEKPVRIGTLITCILGCVLGSGGSAPTAGKQAAPGQSSG